MNTTTNHQWLTNAAAVCVIIFSLTGSAMFVSALIQMQKRPAVSSKVLLPATQEIIQPQPLLPMLGEDPVLEPRLGEPRPGAEVHEKFERARIMASYKALHSIYN